MTIQTVELCGERYVILPEREFLELQRKVPATAAIEPTLSPDGGFREVVPLRVGGIPASELLIRDRR
jgi:hypothetical protein